MTSYFEGDVFRGGMEFDKEYRIVRHNDRSVRWVHGLGRLDVDSRGQILHMRGTVRDVTERKVSEARLCESEVRYRAAFQNNLDSININRLTDGVYLDCNDAFLRRTGYKREEVIGRSSFEIDIWADTQDREKLLNMLREKSTCTNLEAQFKTKSGEVFWGVLSASVIDLDGVPCILSVTCDISDAKASEERMAAAQRRLERSEERYRTVFQTSFDLITVSHLSDGRLIDANRAYLDFLGVERNKVIGRTSTELGFWAFPGTRETVVQAIIRDGYLRDFETVVLRKNGEKRTVHISASVVEIEGVACIVSVVRDVSAAVEAEGKIKELAFYDPLTHLPNRRLLLDRLEQAVPAALRSDRKRGLLLVDLDNFKTLNDAFGQEAGDLVLREVGQRLKACVRETDTVARLSSDEFGVILEDLSRDPGDAAIQVSHVGAKILAAIAQPHLIPDRECLNTASIGVVVFGSHPESAKAILQQADLAMRQAKENGRRMMCFFTPALQFKVNARVSLEEDLRRAIKANQFVLYFQPQIERDKIVGAESLIRWKHPRRGSLAPAEFISLAEETGLILPMGRWVLEAACAQLAAWANTGGNGPHQHCGQRQRTTVPSIRLR